VVVQAISIGTGRRKNAVARVRLLPGSGKILVNGQPFEQYFPGSRLSNTFPAFRCRR